MQRSNLLQGFGVGAGLTYLFDRTRGAQRRAQVRDRLGHAGREIKRGAVVLLSDMRHRSRGILARARSHWRSEQVDDSVLLERVRAQLGRLCSHPGAIQVLARQSEIELRGSVLRDEHEGVLTGVRHVRGVRLIHDQLTAHDSAERVPELQGNRVKPQIRRGIRREQWTPTTRFFVAVGGASLLLDGLMRRGWGGRVRVLTGAGLLARSLFNQNLGRVLGLRPGEIRVKKTLVVDAPVDEVFALWSTPEKFPKFMSHVKEVTPKPEQGQYHWKVTGPAGTSYQWDAQMTELVQDRLVAWRSVPGSGLDTHGRVLLRPVQQGTEIDIDLTYSPPAGRVGHTLARLLLADPKRQMDDDMVRLRSLLERGRTSVRGESTTVEELLPQRKSAA